MLLKVKELGIRDRSRLYYIQNHTGYNAVIRLSAKGPIGEEDIQVAMINTNYYREYRGAGELGAGPPRISDVPNGYRTIAAFLATWEHATDDQRADLCEYDENPSNGFSSWCNKPMVRHVRKRDKWSALATEDHPRLVPAKEAGDGWLACYTQDLRQALKRTKGPMRIGPITIHSKRLKDLFSVKSTIGAAPVVEIMELPDHDKLAIRTKDRHAQCTLKHGAGDPYLGRNGFTSRISFTPA